MFFDHRVGYAAKERRHLLETLLGTTEAVWDGMLHYRVAAGQAVTVGLEAFPAVLDDKVRRAEGRSSSTGEGKQRGGGEKGRGRGEGAGKTERWRGEGAGAGEGRGPAVAPGRRACVSIDRACVAYACAPCDKTARSASLQFLSSCDREARSAPLFRKRGRPARPDVIRIGAPDWVFVCLLNFVLDGGLVSFLAVFPAARARASCLRFRWCRSALTCRCFPARCVPPCGGASSPAAPRRSDGAGPSS